jgi:hypothetical protein
LQQAIIYEKKISNLRMGDIVYFKRDETVPINFLVLDSKEEEIILSVWKSQENTAHAIKKPVKLTRGCPLPFSFFF